VQVKLDLSPFSDEGFRLNDNITTDMSYRELREYLFEYAKHFREYREPQLEYGTLRELVWRFPDWSSEAWKMLSECARTLGKSDEAEAAAKNCKILEDRSQ
jgi:hypothetical protein